MSRFLKFISIALGFVALALLGLSSVQPGVISQSPPQPTTATSAPLRDERVLLPPPSITNTKSPATTLAPKVTTTKVTTQATALPSPVMVSEKPTVSTPGTLITTRTSTTPLSSTTTIGTGSASVPNGSGALNQKDIVALTNVARATEGLAPLTFNAQLASMANVKALDMITQQYFAHVSPDGTDVSQLAQNADYLYLNLGENLALGDFRSSEEVVTGWMNSPGHRANIMNKNFTEIGVSAVVGNYEGRMVWYSVQEFGRPMPDCPKPDVLLEKKIALYETQIDATEATIAHLRAEIDAPDIDRETYKAKVTDYNTLVTFYNGLVANVKANVETYNLSVHAYNACIGTAAN